MKPDQDEYFNVIFCRPLDLIKMSQLMKSTGLYVPVIFRHRSIYFSDHVRDRAFDGEKTFFQARIVFLLMLDPVSLIVLPLHIIF